MPETSNTILSHENSVNTDNTVYLLILSNIHKLGLMMHGLCVDSQLLSVLSTKERGVI